MKLIEQSYEIISMTENPLQAIEQAGRICYKSEKLITATSASKFVSKMNSLGHGAVIEFADMTIKFITNRGVSHELVRHRLCSFAQESTRYIRYGDDIEFIKPVWTDLECKEYRSFIIPTESESGKRVLWAELTFIEACHRSAIYYRDLLNEGWRPEQAREVLNHAIKTEIIVKANMREWQHILKLRCSPKSHPQIVALLTPLRDELALSLPELFGKKDICKCKCKKEF